MVVVAGMKTLNDNAEPTKVERVTYLTKDADYAVCCPFYSWLYGDINVLPLICCVLSQYKYAAVVHLLQFKAIKHPSIIPIIWQQSRLRQLPSQTTNDWYGNINVDWRGMQMVIISLTVL